MELGACSAGLMVEDAPLTEEEIAEWSQIRCAVCGQHVSPEAIAAHSLSCVLVPQLDKWCNVSATMTAQEKKVFLQMRRREELAQVMDLEEKHSSLPAPLWWMPGKFGFVISSKWLSEWRNFVGGRSAAVPEGHDRPPGPINNQELLNSDGTLRCDLREGNEADYQTLEQPFWEFYSQVYGGGPQILRYSFAGLMPNGSEEVAVFEGDWRDSRPDTGIGRVFDSQSGNGFHGEIREGFLWTCTGRGLLGSGSHYEGRVVDGLPEGHGCEVGPDGTVTEGFFKRGLLHGRGFILDPRGNCAEGEWEDGVLVGI